MGADHELPLTEGGERLALSEDEALIRRLVDAFYERVREDELLGPVFDAHVQDWSRHLAKMYDFWSSMVLRTGRYSGRPIMAHMKIEGLTGRHFERWLALWGETVERIAPAAARAPFIDAAERMGKAMREQVVGE